LSWVTGVFGLSEPSFGSHIQGWMELLKGHDWVTSRSLKHYKLYDCGLENVAKGCYVISRWDLELIPVYFVYCRWLGGNC
jgi:hypothetical protein